MAVTNATTNVAQLLARIESWHLVVMRELSRFKTNHMTELLHHLFDKDGELRAGAVEGIVELSNRHAESFCDRIERLGGLWPKVGAMDLLECHNLIGVICGAALGDEVARHQLSLATSAIDHQNLKEIAPVLIHVVERALNLWRTGESGRVHVRETLGSSLFLCSSKRAFQKLTTDDIDREFSVKGRKASKIAAALAVACGAVDETDVKKAYTNFRLAVTASAKKKGSLKVKGTRPKRGKGRARKARGKAS